MTPPPDHPTEITTSEITVKLQQVTFTCHRRIADWLMELHWPNEGYMQVTATFREAGALMAILTNCDHMQNQDPHGIDPWLDAQYKIVLAWLKQHDIPREYAGIC